MAGEAVQRAARNRVFGPSPGSGKGLVQGKANLSPARRETSYPFWPVDRKGQPTFPRTIYRKPGE